MMLRPVADELTTARFAEHCKAMQPVRSTGNDVQKQLRHVAKPNERGCVPPSGYTPSYTKRVLLAVVVIALVQARLRALSRIYCSKATQAHAMVETLNRDAAVLAYAIASSRKRI